MSPRRPATPDQGKAGDPEKDQVEATDAKQAAATEAAAEEASKPKPRRARRKATPKAKDTAAEPVTERERSEAKDAAEAALDQPVEAAETAEEAPAEPVAEATPKPRRTRRKAADDKPAEPVAAPRRAPRDYGDAPPMVRAHAKYVRTSARKARLVCDHIRGKSVPEARAILAHASRDVARDWSKLLESAVANAEHNHELIGDELRIHAVKADEGPTLKRFRPRAMGRATKIRKRTSHLSITLTPKDGDR
jgi:ribosomal protein L22